MVEVINIMNLWTRLFARAKAPIAYTLVFLCWMGPGCKNTGGPHEMLTVDQKDNNTQVVLTIGQELEVLLPENPTTGFRWQIRAAGEPVLELLNDKFDSPASGIGMVYRRAWEQDQSSGEMFRLAVRVQP